MAQGTISPIYDTELENIRSQLAYADALRKKSLDSGGQMVGNIYVTKNPWLNFAEGLAGGAVNRYQRDKQTGLERQMEQGRQDWLGQMPAAEAAQVYDPANTPGTGPLDTTQMLPKSAKQYGQEMTTWGMQAPRGMEGVQQFALQQAMTAPQREQARQEQIAAQEQARQERLIAEREKRDWQAQQDEKYKRTFEQMLTLKQTPSVNISLSNRDGKGADDGKPLSGPQERAALELGGNYQTLGILADTFRDEYAGGPGKILQRAAGGLVGGLAPKDTQAMTRWWADQAMYDELPQRNALFGATLTPNEQRAWREAAISPNLSPAVIRERLAKRKELYERSAARMRASAVAGGKSGAQFDAATGIGAPRPAAPTGDGEFKVLGVR
jgi:hypothetical protein